MELGQRVAWNQDSVVGTRTDWYGTRTEWFGARTEVVRNGASNELYLATVIGNLMILSMIPLLRALINLRGLQTKEGRRDSRH